MASFSMGSPIRSCHSGTGNWDLGPYQSGFEIVAVFKDIEEILAVLGGRGRQMEVLHDPT